MLKYAHLGKGRRIHLLDTTPVEVALENQDVWISQSGQKR